MCRPLKPRASPAPSLPVFDEECPSGGRHRAGRDGDIAGLDHAAQSPRSIAEVPLPEFLAATSRRGDDEAVDPDQPKRADPEGGGGGADTMPRNMQAFLIAQPGKDGSLALHPMKAWLRQHPRPHPAGYPRRYDELESHCARTDPDRVAARTDRGEFRSLPPDVPTTSRPEDGVDMEGAAAGDPLAFELEAQLRDFLAHNLHTIRLNGRSLRLYVDQAQREGVEYPTATGPIDILAVDQNGGLVVFELKRAASPDSAIGQLTRYMGWVQARSRRASRCTGSSSPSSSPIG